jgi:hypothetical protein
VDTTRDDQYASFNAASHDFKRHHHSDNYRAVAWRHPDCHPSQTSRHTRSICSYSDANSAEHSGRGHS